MKFKISISLLFSIVVLCEIYIVSFRINLLIQIAFLVLLFLTDTNRLKVSVSFLKTIFPIIIVFLIGFIGSFFSNYSSVDIIKDISHFIKPIVVLMIGYVVFKSINDTSLFLKTIITTASITAIIHLIRVFVISDFFSNSIQEIRGVNGLDNFIEIFALLFLIIVPRTQIKPLYKNDNFRMILILIFSISIFAYFSRTMFGMILFLSLSFYGFTKITRKSIKVILFSALIVGLFYSYLGTMKLARNSNGIESLFYKIKMAPGEVFNAKLNRENHAVLWDHWRAYEAKRAISLMNRNPYSYVFGNGYGSLVNLKFKAPLGDGDGMRYISVTHNGYIFVLYKTGIIGIIFYFGFLIKLYLRAYHKNATSQEQFFKTLVSTIGIYFLFTSLIITGIYIPKDAILFILGGALYHENNS